MSHDQKAVSRRRFIQGSTAGAALLATSASAVAESHSPNENMRIGYIGVGGRCQKHVDSALELQAKGAAVEVAAVCDVYKHNLNRTAAKVEWKTGKRPMSTGDYRDILADDSIDAVCIATPDHWHARQTIDALKAGKHVYCEKPMTHTVEEALDVMQTWQKSGLVMQVGVQSTSLPVWGKVNESLRAGDIGKVLQYQTEYFRNSDVGQWRYYSLRGDMTPKNVDWNTFLGREFDLAPDMPFDRAKFAQWRCYWPFGSGLYTDLFVHRTTTIAACHGATFSRARCGGWWYLSGV